MTDGEKIIIKCFTPVLKGDQRNLICKKCTGTYARRVVGFNIFKYKHHKMHWFTYIVLDNGAVRQSVLKSVLRANEFLHFLKQKQQHYVVHKASTIPQTGLVSAFILNIPRTANSLDFQIAN